VPILVHGMRKAARASLKNRAVARLSREHMERFSFCSFHMLFRMATRDRGGIRDRRLHRVIF
jgi:hypothetical protein